MKTKLHITKPLISVDWLVENIDAPNLVIIDATLKKITWEKNEFEHQDIGIENAQFLDIKNIFSDTSTSLPNMMLSQEKFQEQARILGINNNSAIVVYDAIGIFSSTRVWWMLKSMGHENVAVLDGGLPEWIRKGYPTASLKNHAITKGNFKPTFHKNFFSDTKDVLDATLNKNRVIADARSNDRFMGLVDEPREGLRVGHIPTSKNIPYADVQTHGKMLLEDELIAIFNTDYKDKEQVIFSCGSGITACILALGAEIAGVKNISVYDGSWTEWGSNHELPIEK